MDATVSLAHVHVEAPIYGAQPFELPEHACTEVAFGILPCIVQQGTQRLLHCSQNVLVQPL
jgi:hypothetical protein